MKFKKVNDFKVIEKKDSRFVIQEEKDKNKFFLFWLKHKKNIVVSLSMILVCILLVVFGLSLSLFRGSNDYDITYIVGDDEITVNPPDVDDEDIKDELLGEIAREDGVVLLSDTFMTSSGDVISYFTDKTAIVVRADGKIYRISSDHKGDYGIDKNGKIDKTAKKLLVTSTTTALEDGTVITNYSDGTAKVELNGNAMFVRDSNNVELLDGKNFVKGNPSGVSIGKNVSRVNGYYINKFTDGTTFISVGNKKYVVNKNTMPNISNGNVSFDKNNAFESIRERSYADGYTINHYSNGSATITDKAGNMFFVRKSGDLRFKDKQLYEIIPSDKGYSRPDIKTSDGTIVTYYDNNDAVVKKPDGTRVYVEDSDQIIYNEDKNIISDYEFSVLIGKGITKDKELVYNFDNGKSQVVNKINGSSYIVDTDSLDYTPITDEEIPDEEVKEEDKNEEKPEKDPSEDFVIFEQETNYLNDAKSEKTTSFIIENRKKRKRRLVISIKDVSDYSKYNISEDKKLDPSHINFTIQSSGGLDGDCSDTKPLVDDNIWVDNNGDTNYIICDINIGARARVTIDTWLTVNYKNLFNTAEQDDQNKAFVGNINIYVEDEE